MEQKKELTLEKTQALRKRLFFLIEEYSKELDLDNDMGAWTIINRIKRELSEQMDALVVLSGGSLLRGEQLK